MTLTRKWNQCANAAEDFRNRPVGGVEIIRANEFPNLVQVKNGASG